MKNIFFYRIMLGIIFYYFIQIINHMLIKMDMELSNFLSVFYSKMKSRIKVMILHGKKYFVSFLSYQGSNDG